MELESILQYARERGLSPQDASQTFMQIVVLRNLNLPQARLMGGAALVLGHANPRFSEDIDLTQIAAPDLLRPGLLKASQELTGWLGKKVILTPPKRDTRTWVLTCPVSRSETLRLHIDSQPYPAYTRQPIVITFPSIPDFVFDALKVEEILSEKLVAVAYRRYLGGRDLFDLWFHWLRHDDWAFKLEEIRGYLSKKLHDRSLEQTEFKRRLKARLSPPDSLNHARQEWRRYLPANFQRKEIYREILVSIGKAVEVLTS